MVTGQQTIGYTRNVRHEGDEVYVAGVERLTYGSGVPHAYIASLTSMLRACGHNCDYALLLGGSGVAFRVWIDPSRGPEPIIWAHDDGYVEAAWALAGFERLKITLEGSGDKSKGVFLEAVREVLGSGRPLIAPDLVFEGVSGVVAGLSGQALLCRLIGDESSAYQRVECSVTCVETVASSVPVDEAAVLGQTLARVAADEADDCAAEGIVSGEAALRAWADWLRDEAIRCELDDAEMERAMRNNCLVYHWLVDARQCLPGFLRYASGALKAEPAVAAGLGEAASLYARLGGKLKSGVSLAAAEGGCWRARSRELLAELLEECAGLEHDARETFVSALRQ